MAQTKKRAAPKRTSSKRKTNATKPRSSAKSRSSSTKARPSAKASSGNGSPAATVRHEVEDKAKGAGQAVGKAGQTVGKAASKAKVPLIAGGAAIAGATAGIALASRQDRHRRLAASMRKPRIKLTSKDVAKAAQEVGRFSTQMGDLASELQRAREGNGKHRSPIEVVLEGLTSRR